MRIGEIEKQIEEGLLSSSGSLTEDQAKSIFKLFNIPVVEEKKATKAKDVLDACQTTGFPVVLKGVGKTLLHKTEKGLVRVGLNTKDQVKAALQEMKASAGDALEAFLVQPVIQGKREFMAGMFRDPQFGPVIMFGLGGVLTEALKDTVLKIAPLNDADMEDMFNQLSSKKLLDAFRGEAPADKKTLKIILRGLSDMALTYWNIKEIDINPVIIRPDGSPVAVDGLIVLEKAGQKEKRTNGIDLSILGSCYYPKSVAFIGASATPGKWGHMLFTK